MATLTLPEIQVPSSLDGSLEPSLFYCPESRTATPLVVGLHTWSFDRFNQVANMLPLCQARGWALLLPEFRGPNTAGNPRVRQAGGSRLARQDIVDALEYVCAHYPLDRHRVFLLGGSGGGHMALRTAAHAPDRFAAVSAWVPITDLAAWHGENPNYAPGIVACCGGVPGASAAVDAEYHDRSPIFHLEALKTVRLAVHHGRFDPSVPYSHTVKLAQALEQLQPPQFFYEVFDGKHEIRYERAFAWFDGIAAATHARQQLTG